MACSEARFGLHPSSGSIWMIWRRLPACSVLTHHRKMRCTPTNSILLQTLHASAHRSVPRQARERVRLARQRPPPIVQEACLRAPFVPKGVCIVNVFCTLEKSSIPRQSVHVDEVPRSPRTPRRSAEAPAPPPPAADNGVGQGSAGRSGEPVALHRFVPCVRFLQG